MGLAKGGHPSIKYLVAVSYGCGLPSGKANLVLRIHGYLQRYGYINYGMFSRVNPMHGEESLLK